MVTSPLHTFRKVYSTYVSQESSPTPLAVARILFGMLMVFSSVRFVALGWVDAQYIRPVMHFGYSGFEWVTSVGYPGMYIVFGAMILSAVGIMLGAWYRTSAVMFFLLFTYVELIDKTYYLNHYYFVSIAALLFCILPANSAFSIDALRKRAIARVVIPRWTTDVLKIQISIVYFFAGIAKINPDWLFNAMPLRIWLPAHDSMPILGSLFALPFTPWIFSWMGMLFDVTIPFFLWNNKTRWYAYATVVAFHSVTGFLFQIGVFPLVMMGMTLIFLIPSFNPNAASSAILAGSTNSSVSTKPTGTTKPTGSTETRSPLQKLYPVLRPLLVVFFAVQILLPLRFLLYSGNLFWTEEGYRFSWRVMLMEKSGAATFYVLDKNTGRTGVVANGEFLNPHQEKQMAMQPDMIVQYARWLREHYAQHGVAEPMVMADVWVTLNGQPSRQLVDPNVDLSREELGMHQYKWVLSND
ncbi:MAG: HTTM domain-containing protein [Ignavibacteria bacterium]|nr:HTTM domain-containing protein [Ignavibacteria bacterium]